MCVCALCLYACSVLFYVQMYRRDLSAEDNVRLNDGVPTSSKTKKAIAKDINCQFVEQKNVCP